MDIRSTAPPPSRRLRRWLIVVGVAVAVLGLYGFSLNWFAQQLGDDMQKSIRMPTATSERETAGGYY